jgi:plasmid stability protein
VSAHTYIITLVMYFCVMRRTQIYLDDDLDVALRQLAAADGRSAAALIRDALRSYLRERRTASPHDPILAAAGTVVGLPPDAAEQHDHDLYRDGKPGRRRRA